MTPNQFSNMLPFLLSPSLSHTYAHSFSHIPHPTSGVWTEDNRAYIQYGNSPLQQIRADFKYWEGHPNLGACPRGMTSKEGILGIVLPFIIKICTQCLQNRMRNLDYFTSFSTVPAGWPVAAVITFLAKGGLLTALPLSKRTCDPLFPFYFSSPSPTPYRQRRHAHWAKTSLYN